MTETATKYDSSSNISPNDRVNVPTRPELGVGEVLRIAEFAGTYRADVVFDLPEGRRLETLPVELVPAFRSRPEHGRSTSNPRKAIAPRPSASYCSRDPAN